MFRRIGAIVAITMLTFTRSAHADDDAASSPPPPPVMFPPPQLDTAEDVPSPYRFRAGLEIPIIAAGTAMLMTAFVPSTPAPCLPNCEVPSTMNAVDRAALGGRSETAGAVADVALAAVLLAPHLANLVVTRGKENAWLEDVLISAEATLFATGTSQVLKTSTRRYSPSVYDAGLSVEERSHPEAVRSFWSSHTATATAAATSFAVSYWLRHPGSPWRWAVLGGLEATAIGVGVMTVLAGWHFPTDVAAGALFGVASGVAIPMLHTVW